jgi:hypothetical protein
MSSETTTRFGVLAYGSRPRLHSECHGAILSVMAHAPAGVEYVVLTDRPDCYRWLEDSITIEHLPPTTLNAWRGPTGDRYRPKIEALRRMAGRGDANVVLVDTDTFARRALGPLVERLDRGVFLLHRREYPLSEAPRRGDRMLKHEILGRTWHGITPTSRTAMWNGGVIGCGRSHLSVFDQVAAVFDTMRPASTHFAIEQLAYSVVFEAHGPVEEAAPWIDHYWANRSFFSRAIERELAKILMSGMTPAEAAAHLRDHPVSGPLDGRPTKWRRAVRRVARAFRLDAASEHPDD